MSRQDVKAGRESSEYKLAMAGFILGCVLVLGAFALTLLRHLQAMPGAAAMLGGSGIVAVAVHGYSSSRARIKASAHAPPPVHAGAPRV